MNPLITSMANRAVGDMPQMQMLQQFQQFRQQGWTEQTAQAKIGEMMQSGQINGQMLERAKAMAQRMSWLLPQK